MPWENIGECGCADFRERDRMVAEVELGVQYVKLICGPPPQGCKVGVMWHEHDSGSYATVGLFWNPLSISDAPGAYISRAEDVLGRFDDSVTWSPVSEREEDDEDEEVEDGENSDNDIEEATDDAGECRRHR